MNERTSELETTRDLQQQQKTYTICIVIFFLRKMQLVLVVLEFQGNFSIEQSAAQTHTQQIALIHSRVNIHCAHSDINKHFVKYVVKYTRA